MFKLYNYCCAVVFWKLWRRQMWNSRSDWLEPMAGTVQLCRINCWSQPGYSRRCKHQGGRRISSVGFLPRLYLHSTKRCTGCMEFWASSADTLIPKRAATFWKWDHILSATSAL